MTEEKIIDQLKRLQTLGPREDFKRSLRAELLAAPRLGRLPVGRWTLSRVLNYAAPVAAAAIIFIVVFSQNNLNWLIKESDAPKTSNGNYINLAMVEEAKAAIKDINVQLNETQYLSAESSKMNEALSVAASSSEAVVKPSAPIKANVQNQTPNINDLLNEASQ